MIKKPWIYFIGLCEVGEALHECEYTESEAHANEIITAPALEHPPLRSLTEAAEANAFHAHLEVCSQCENAPFNLCPTGTELIHSVATLLPFASARAKCNCGATRHVREDGTRDIRCPLYEEEPILEISKLTAYQGGVFLILTDGRAGKRFGVAAALELIAKHSVLISERERRRFEPLATARAIIEAEADSVCEDIDVTLEGAIADTRRLDRLEEFIQTGVIETAFEMDGGVHLTLSRVGDRELIAYREQNSLREAIDQAIKEGSL